MITELDNIVVTGDGSIMQTASSRYGKTTCECRKKGDYKCGHSRIYSSRTAQICYDHHHNKDVRLDNNGIPLCRAGMPMRHHQYNKNRKTHVFCCPVKRQTHRKGKTVYVTHIDECPLKKDCQPENSLGPLVYIKSNSNPRLFPPVSRDSRQYEKIMNLRSGSERVNAYIDNYNIEKAHRNVDYSLIRLFLVYIAIHAEIMYKEFLKIEISEKLLDNSVDAHSSGIEFDKILTNIRDGPLNKPP
ncbi:hypothetical protein [Desulfonema limicola]|nr:hypothetical protein [Desulfonema limicola]